MKFMSKVWGRYEVLAMSNLRPSDTGIDGVVIWFSGKDSQHAPRVKVIVGGGKVTAKDLRNARSAKTSFSVYPAQPRDAA
jgi:hypothetical protein